ncbi:MAG: bacteriohopanetetrol glucosamine biosynthesis glycosyltransferase HpnI [Janthinobacterium lividum]
MGSGNSFATTLNVVIDPAFALPLVTALLTVCGIGYSVLALWGARRFRLAAKAQASASPSVASLPGISVLKPLRGLDSRMYAGFVSHCTQTYPGPFELIFGVGSLEDAAVAEVAKLRVEYPHIPIQLIECTKRLGTNGKLSSLTQMLPHAAFEHVVVNDSDILVSPNYLTCIVAPFLQSRTQPTGAGAAMQGVGLVTVPYLGRSERTLFSRLEALGISTDFIPGVLAARALEGGLRFGLGSTLATTKTALASIGGFAPLVDQLADDYELGARLHKAGYRVELVAEIVATSVPAYTLRGFADHQLRWSRSTRDSRRAGYFGLLFTYVLPWALATVLASGFALWSFSLLSVALLARIAVALTVGVGLLQDGQVLRDLALLPVRDGFALFFWAWSYASDEVVWRGERFRLHRGMLEKV